MKQGWEIKKLGEVCKVIAGQSPEGKYYNSEGNGMPFYQGKKEYREKYIGEPTTWTTKITKEAEAGDILMSVRAPVGPVNFATQKICIGRGLSAIRAGKNIDKEFLFNYLIKHESEIEGNAGAVFNSINKTQIESLEIPLPPLPEQQRIVSILDECFAAIAKAKANAGQNLKNARELFESYLQGVFEEKVEDWEEKKLGEVIEYDKNQNIHKGLPYIGLEHIESNSGRFLGSLEPQEVKSSTFHFDEEHVLYGRLRPYLNKVLLPDFEGHCSTEIFPIKVQKEIVKEFLFYWLIAGSTVKKIDATWTGARMPRANMNQVLEFDFAFPSLQEQQTIVHQLDALRAETKKLEAIYQQKLLNLEELKKSILQNAFNGEL
jgi:type I restriction enzyme S subunit